MKNFYQNILGLSMDTEYKGFCAFKAESGDTFEVFDEDVNEYPHFTSSPVAGFQVDDIYAVRQNMEGAGIEFIGDIDGNPERSLWAHFRGPDDNIYELKWVAPRKPKT
jgi:hypothetical protein